MRSVGFEPTSNLEYPVGPAALPLSYDLIVELRIRVKLIFKVLQTLHFIGSNEAFWLERGGSNS